MTTRGIIACGHPVTAHAAEEVLRAGGNAFDAAVAAFCAACVAEPVLASFGGGGFLLARTATGQQLLYDFFAQTPRRPRPQDALDFFPISADFGTARQIFHMGLGSVATPGVARGLFAVHQDLGTLPMQDLVAPAVASAREGVEMNRFQAMIFDIVAPIYTAHAETRATYAGRDGSGSLLRAGEILRQSELADFMEALAREGAEWFYEGEIATAIAELCQAGGGHLVREDLSNYRVARRSPLCLDYRGVSLATNPPPSSGGILIAFALRLMEALDFSVRSADDPSHLHQLARVMDLTNQARIEAALDQANHPHALRLLDVDYLRRYRMELLGRARSSRGTTHISVIDAEGNIASLTASNGEGCGRLIPDTGVMLNNMLGEEDLNPHGFHAWPANQRMTSMMAPSLAVFPDGTSVALGSGGSNRIRTAILQVLVNLIDFGLPIAEAVSRPRIHLEGRRLSIEGGFDESLTGQLRELWPDTEVWSSRNLFFGGVHGVMRQADGLLDGAGDPRRGGVVVHVD